MERYKAFLELSKQRQAARKQFSNSLFYAIEEIKLAEQTRELIQLANELRIIDVSLRHDGQYALQLNGDLAFLQEITDSPVTTTVTEDFNLIWTKHSCVIDEIVLLVIDFESKPNEEHKNAQAI